MKKYDLQHANVCYTVLKHRSMGPLILDPRAQTSVGPKKARLFVVSQNRMATFRIDAIDAEFVEDIEQNLVNALRHYTELRGRQRSTHCWKCKTNLNDVDFSVCKTCHWIVCPCGACGCKAPRFHA